MIVVAADESDDIEESPPPPLANDDDEEDDGCENFIRETLIFGEGDKDDETWGLFICTFRSSLRLLLEVPPLPPPTTLVIDANFVADNELNPLFSSSSSSSIWGKVSIWFWHIRELVVDDVVDGWTRIWIWLSCDTIDGDDVVDVVVMEEAVYMAVCCDSTVATTFVRWETIKFSQFSLDNNGVVRLGVGDVDTDTDTDVVTKPIESSFLSTICVLFVIWWWGESIGEYDGVSLAGNSESFLNFIVVVLLISPGAWLPPRQGRQQRNSVTHKTFSFVVD